MGIWIKAENDRRDGRATSSGNASSSLLSPSLSVALSAAAAMFCYWTDCDSFKEKKKQTYRQCEYADVTSYMGKSSAADQPSRPTQPFILSGSINE